MAHIPSRDDILKFVSEQSGKIGKREIARAFDIKGSDRIPLKNLLREMTAEGLLEGEGRQKDLRKGGDLPSVAVLNITGRDDDGAFLALPHNKEMTPPPLITIDEKGGQKAGRINRRHNLVSMGDMILARLTQQGDNIYSANIIRKLTNNDDTPIIGVVQEKDNVLFLSPANRRDRHDYIIAPSSDVKINITYKEGDLVIGTKISGKNKYDSHKARITQNIGSAADPHAFSLLAIAENDIPDHFPAELLAEVEAITALTPSSNEPLLDLPFVTIDPADARDHDDAVYAETTDDGFSIWVAIADVAAYVTPASTLDKQARIRGNSVYLPDRVVPMLPERLSTDLCSLKEGVPRPSLAVKMDINKAGKVVSHQFMRGFICSQASLTYSQAQATFNGESKHMDAVLTPLWQAYQAMAQAREKRGPLDLDLPEHRIILNEDGTIKDIDIPPRLEAHRLIEEMMVSANVCAAKTLQKHNIPFIYRVHDAPSQEKVDTLVSFLRGFSLRLDKGQVLRPSLFNNILRQSRNTAHNHSVSDSILRSQMQAIYTPENIGHFGLNLGSYTHFTSPIRRYSDVLVHRALIASLGLGTNERGDTQEDTNTLVETAAHISSTERRAVSAERSANDRYLSAFMAKGVGKDYEARISGISRGGIFVRIEQTGADGIIPMSMLGDDRFFPDKDGLTLTGKRTRKRYRLGDKIYVTLLEATPIKGGLLFAPKNSGVKQKSKSKSKPKHSRKRKGK
ncbi:MAG: ribonuclease R [Alphaproteobacteria bacterium]|nr:ribonuclease R [Alphaproteobacteria bacterium]